MDFGDLISTKWCSNDQGIIFIIYDEPDRSI